VPSISRFAYSLRCLTLAVAGLVVSTIAAAADYRVSSGDVLDITIFRVPDLSRQLTVDVTGQVAFPPIGEIKVDDATLEEIGIRIRAALQEQGILTDAQVTVGLVATRPVIVGGDVATPGAVPFHAGLTVRRAIAMAGGVGMSRTRGMEDIAELRSQRDVDRVGPDAGACARCPPLRRACGQQRCHAHDPWTAARLDRASATRSWQPRLVA